MAWPEWDSVWLTQYPALRSVTAYAPGYSLNNSVDVNSIVNASGNTSIWNPGSWIKGSSVLSDGQRSLLPLSGNWIGSALSDAQFVSADPLQTLDFRVQQSSPIWKASARSANHVPTAPHAQPSSSLPASLIVQSGGDYDFAGALLR